MKKYLLSLLFVSGALLAMDAPTAETELIPMAGPSFSDFKEKTVKALRTYGYTVKEDLENINPLIKKQGNKTILIFLLNLRNYAVARFNEDGSLDTTFNKEGPGTPGIAIIAVSLNQIDENKITNVSISDTTIELKGIAKNLEAGMWPQSYTIKLNKDGEVIKEAKIITF